LPPLTAGVAYQNPTSPAASSHENSNVIAINTPLSRISEITNTQSEIECQRNVIEELKRQLELSKSARTIKSAGKKPVSNGQTSLHYGIVIPQLEDYWSRDKFLPELWHKWFTIGDPPKFCHVMTKGVTPPPGYEGLPEYYEKVLINMIITKWRALKSNATKAMRDWWKSKCFHWITHDANTIYSISHHLLEQNLMGSLHHTELVKYMLHPRKCKLSLLLQDPKETDNSSDEDEVLLSIKDLGKSLYSLLLCCARNIYTLVSNIASRYSCNLALT